MAERAEVIRKIVGGHARGAGIFRTGKAEISDAGYAQLKTAVQNDEEGKLFLAALKEAHRALGDKLLPQAYYYGFIPRDVEYFEEEV